MFQEYQQLMRLHIKFTSAHRYFFLNKTSNQKMKTVRFIFIIFTFIVMDIIYNMTF